ncbi:MAG TPA: anti-sigma factor [Candidatus Obscuribacterales bacterium]
MTGPLPPERLEELLAGYVLGNLSSEEAEELQKILVEHPEFRDELHHLQQALEVLPYALPESFPVSALRSNLLETASLKNNARSTPKTKIIRFSLPWKQLAGGLAAALVLVFCVDNYRLRQQAVSQQALIARQKDVIAMLQQPNTHLVSLKGLEPAAAASGSIVITPGESNIVLVLQNLPILPAGQFYYLWSVVEGKKILWGQFKANSQGRVFVKLVPPSSEMTALVVTVESGSQPERPAGPMVMTSSL